MASLTPCTVCHRHVRRHERACPFCGAERKPTAGAFREALLAREASRATLIALGLTLAGQACGGKEDEGDDRSNVGIIPPYGLGPVNEPAAGSGGSGSGGTGSGGRPDPTGEGGSYTTVPPYGAMPPPTPDIGMPDSGGGGGGGADTPDAGTPPDAGEDASPPEPDAGN